MYSSTLSQQARFKTGLARLESDTSIESPFNIPMIANWLKPVSLTDTQGWSIWEWWASRKRDAEQEIPKVEPPPEVPTEFPRPAVANNQLLQFDQI